MKRILQVFTLLHYIFLISYSGSIIAQFSFIHITDVHVADGTLVGNIGNYDMNGSEFRCCIRKFRSLSPKPAFVIATGDISNVGSIPPDGMYNALTRHLFPHPLTNPAPGEYFIDLAQTIPIYIVSGNHEYYASIVPPIIQNPEYYSENVAPDEDYVIAKENAVILFLRTGHDNPFWENENILNPIGMGISDEQCHWLRETLQAAGNKRKIIVMHHPVDNVAGTSYNGSPRPPSTAPADEGYFLYNRPVFMNICDSNHVDVVLAGHKHQNVVANRAGNIVDENWPDATRYIQTSQAFKGSYRIITVTSSFVNVSKPKRVDCSADDHGSYTSTCIYPNPLSSIATLELHTSENIVDYEMRIYTLQGNEVKRISGINSTVSEIEKGNLKTGIYFYTVLNAQGLVQGSGKLIINNL